MKTKIIISALIISFIVNLCFIESEKIHIFDYISKKFHPNKSIVFFGDSRIQNGDWNWCYKRMDVQKSGFGGFTTSDLLPKIKTDIIAYHPKTCFIEAGINDILLGIKYNVPLTKTYRAYQSIIDTLIENKITPVIQSVIYVNSSNAEINQRVDSVNDFLISYCLAKKLQYIELNAQLSTNHQLDMEYSTGDGVHFNEAGYNVWYNRIKSDLN